MKKLFILLASVLMLASCQDEEFGYTKGEIAASAAHRHYIEEFEKEFATIDPTHTWLCTPDTTYGASLRAITRAGSGVPVVTQVKDTILTVSYANVTAALRFVEEAEDNRGKCSQDFEYLSTEEKNVFDIHPVFWGEKFCEHNAVGVWYLDSNGKRHDLEPFWSDWNSQIYAVCEHGIQQIINSTSHPITEDPKESWNQHEPFKMHQHWDGWHQVYCNPDHYEFPSYKIEVPVGMQWGLYLETYQNQSNSKPLIRWYSNAEYNPNHASAAASFEFGGINYVSFEDAPNPYNCTSGGTGTCQSCPTYKGQHFGHYDHDMNDIVLAITPHPIESTYKSISYRVMCEDLGGTFDWDFNDLVLDVIYEEGTQKNAKAKTTITVQAVGGTLPIELLYNGESKQGELHSWFGQSPVESEDGSVLYTPINVAGGETKKAKEWFTINHNWITMSGTYDVREIVKQLSVKVNSYTTVVFPDASGGEVPQCFMCPINVRWSEELVNIADTYPDFPAWVAAQGANPDWWKSGFNTGGQVVVEK